MPSANFAPDLQHELADALREYARTKGAPAADERLKATRDAVCEHAHRWGMAPEGMVVALRRIYDGVAAGHPPQEAQLRGAYDRLLSGCLQAYFEQRRQR
jgi:hypothetical protein